MYIVPKGKISLIEDGFKIIGYSLKTKKYFKLNSDLRDLLLICDGETGLDALYNRLSGGNVDKLKKSINSIIKLLIKDELITLSKVKKYNPVRYRKCDSEYPLRRASIELTNRCNLECKHCYNSSSAFCNNELNKKHILSFVDELDKMGVFEIVLTGGEPLIREDFIEIADYIHNKGMEIVILTNGLLLDDRKISFLKKIRPKEVAVSLDSLNEDKYREIRGISNKHVIENILLLKSEGIKVRLNLVIFQNINDDYGSIYKIFKFLKKNGFSHTNIKIDEFVIAGRGESALRYKITNQKNIIKNIRRACKKIFHREYFFNPYYTDSSLMSQKDEIRSFCGLGENMLFLNCKGEIVPCPMLNEDDFVVGSIFENPVRKIWEKSALFKYFRNKQHIIGTKCERCSKLGICAGGCKAKMMKTTGKFNKPNTWACDYFSQYKIN